MDTVRLVVTPTEAEPDGFQVEIWVNDVEMTAAGAGLGMDPYDVLVPDNRFLPGNGSTTVPVARCECGEYGCGSTDVIITKTDDVVRWDWLLESPMDRAVTFEAAEYEREVMRVAADRSWETPARTAGRLVLSGIDNSELPRGLRFHWVADNWRLPDAFQVCLLHDDQHQIFLNFVWAGRTPDELAVEVRRVLVDKPPGSWDATWSSIQRSDAPPPMAGEAWTRAHLTF